jgi:hypothetical protein
MRYRNYLAAASLAALATAAFANGAAAQSQADLAKEYNADNHQRGCAATDKVYGSKFFVLDDRRYGGCLPIGADKNADAVRVLIKVAQSTGQWRDNQYGGGASRYLVLGDTTPKKRIVGTGTWNGAKADVRMEWDYRIPAVRFYVTGADKKTEIWAASDPRVKPGGQTGHLEQPELFGGGAIAGVQLAAWKEQTPGVYGGASSMTAEELLTLAYLMPSGVVHAGRDAADKMKLSKDGQRDVLTIPVEALGGANLVATLDTDGRPVHTEINLKGKVYSGDFDNFLNDRGDYEVYFPTNITLKQDGKALAEWALEYHHTNPYLIFPVPAEVKK